MESQNISESSTLPSDIEILENIPDTSENTSTIPNTEFNQIGVKNPRSIVHNYFTLDKTSGKYKCNHCDRTYQVAKDGSTSTLKKHLQLKHKDLFSVEQVTNTMNKLEISDTLV